MVLEVMGHVSGGALLAANGGDDRCVLPGNADLRRTSVRCCRSDLSPTPARVVDYDAAGVLCGRCFSVDRIYFCGDSQWRSGQNDAAGVSVGRAHRGRHGELAAPVSLSIHNRAGSRADLHLDCETAESKTRMGIGGDSRRRICNSPSGCRASADQRSSGNSGAFTDVLAFSLVDSPLRVDCDEHLFAGASLGSGS